MSSRNITIVPIATAISISTSRSSKERAPLISADPTPATLARARSRIMCRMPRGTPRRPKHMQRTLVPLRMRIAVENAKTRRSPAADSEPAWANPSLLAPLTRDSPRQSVMPASASTTAIASGCIAAEGVRCRSASQSLNASNLARLLIFDVAEPANIVAITMRHPMTVAPIVTLFQARRP